ncbi:methionine/alanine import family NSS transporter small subunit [Klebsiella pneumoniae]|nr:methionine/alanine import family NSS transporter small subunit [Nocardiopsaceae bacterium]TMZ41905.1 methionine/alanine import family NSS transporter small subunit [Klebsiella pneumoniae]
MSVGAIAMMVIAMVIVWGGLAGAVALLRRHPDRPGEDAEPDS